MFTYVQMGMLILHLETVKSDVFICPLVWDNSMERVARFLPISGHCHIPKGKKTLYPSGCTYKAPSGLAEDAHSSTIPCLRCQKKCC